MLPTERITKNPLLQQEMERLYNMRLAVERILRLSTTPLQRLEAEKTYQVVSLKLMSCLKQVQQEKKADASSASATVDAAKSDDIHLDVAPRLRRAANPGLAKLCLSGIRIPLLWRDAAPVLGTNMQIIMNRLYPPASTSSILIIGGSGDSVRGDKSKDNFDGRSDLTGVGAEASSSYSVFCVIRVDDMIRDTRLIFDIRPNTADVEFDDSLVFENVRPDFRLIVDVYAYPRSTVRSSNWRRTWNLDSTRKTNEPTDASGGSGSGSGSNQFELIGTCVSTITDIQQDIRTRTLEVASRTAEESSDSVDRCSNPWLDWSASGGPINTGQSAGGLPVFGSICYQLIAQPESVLKPVRTGCLWIRKLTASPVQQSAHLYHCELVNRCLVATLVEDGEKEEENKEEEEVVEHLEVDETTDADGLPTDGCPRTNSDEHRSNLERTESSDRPSKAFITLSITPNTVFLDSSPVLRPVHLDIRKRAGVVNRSYSQPNCLAPIDEPRNGKISVCAKGAASPSLSNSVGSFGGDSKPGTDQTVRPISPDASNRLPQFLHLFSVPNMPLPTGNVDDNVNGDSVNSRRLNSQEYEQGQDNSMTSSTPVTTEACGHSPSPQPTNGLYASSSDLCLQPIPGGNPAAPIAPLQDKQLPVSAVPVNLFTFRIAAYSDGSEHLDSMESAQSVSEVFEIASSRPELNRSDVHLREGQSDFSDHAATLLWLRALQKHIEEQETWGETAFSTDVPLPSTVSTVRNISAKRSSSISMQARIGRLQGRATVAPRA